MQPPEIYEITSLIRGSPSVFVVYFKGTPETLQAIRYVGRSANKAPGHSSYFYSYIQAVDELEAMKIFIKIFD